MNTESLKNATILLASFAALTVAVMTNSLVFSIASVFLIVWSGLRKFLP